MNAVVLLTVGTLLLSLESLLTVGPQGLVAVLGLRAIVRLLHALAVLTARLALSGRGGHGQASESGCVRVDASL